ncbi:hypothetical protein GQ457_04G039030 [Hibiscus cannabinus]
MRTNKCVVSNGGECKRRKESKKRRRRRNHIGGGWKSLVLRCSTKRFLFSSSSAAKLPNNNSYITKSGSIHGDAPTRGPLTPLSEEDRRKAASLDLKINQQSTIWLPYGGQKFHEVFQWKQGRYADLPMSKISEMMKSNSLDNAPTRSLLSVVNGILDESFERKNGEIPHRVTCLLRKVVQEIERRVSTQADHLRTQNNLFKIREERYQSRIRVLQVLAAESDKQAKPVTNHPQQTKVRRKKDLSRCSAALNCFYAILWQASLFSCYFPYWKMQLPKKTGNSKVVEKQKVENSKVEEKREVENSKVVEKREVENSKVVEKQKVENSKVEEKREVENSKVVEKQIVENSKVEEKQKVENSKVEEKREVENYKVVEKQKVENSEVVENQKVENSNVEEKPKVENSEVVENQKVENSKVEEKPKVEEVRDDKRELVKETDKNINEIASLKQELEMAKMMHEKRCLEMEKETEDIKATLQSRLKELESLLADSNNRVKEIEVTHESKCQKWNKKVNICHNYMDSQFSTMRELRFTSDAIKQELLKTQKSYFEEFNQLEKKFKSLLYVEGSYREVLAENRKLFNDLQDLKGNIRVFCRIRPFLPGQSGNKTIVDSIGDNGQLVISNPSKPGKEGNKTFKFNKVFGPTATQAEVFSDIQPFIQSVVDGYNVCIFAYGQTGAGKTYTMTGPNDATEEEWGVNYRSLNNLFKISQNRKTTTEYEIGVQMIEIYNDQVRDLLAAKGSGKKYPFIKRVILL